MWKTVVIRIVVDYIIESIWEVNGRLFIARESGCPDRHKTDP
jgi:hypothetical protein